MAKLHNELKDYQNVPRKLIFDETLSDRARFVYCYMAAKPTDWNFLLEPMAKELGYSVDTLRKYINELIESGWLVKGAQSNISGCFGSVEYTIKADKVLPYTENTDTENFRHGKIPTQHNKDYIHKKDIIKEEKDLIEKDKLLFEKCWKAYRRKGVKKAAFEQWKKLTSKEKDGVMQHISAYVSTRDIHFQKDFERYLRDKVFANVVYDKKNHIVFDPSQSYSGTYTPRGHGIYYDENGDFYGFIDMYFDGDEIYDGYGNDDRPDGAMLILNNGRGSICWNNIIKEWERR